MGLRTVWPTFWFDVAACTPFLLLAYFFTFDISRVQLRVVKLIPVSQWEVAYLDELWHSAFLVKACFGMWTVAVILTAGVVIMHAMVTHHPKFYATRCNHIAIVLHVIGGTVSSFGSYSAFIFGNQYLLIVAVISGIVLHYPTAMWQARNLHGSREVMQPGYMFVNMVLLVKEIDVLLSGGSMLSVIEMGVAMGIFANVRFFYFVLQKTNTSMGNVYDRACILATVTSLPGCMGIFGIPMFIATVAFWNALLECFNPHMRHALQVSHSYHTVIPTFFRGRKTDFHGDLKASLLKYPNRHEAVAHAVFNILGEGSDIVTLEEVEELVETWDLPDPKGTAAALFAATDVDHSGGVSFEEFRKQMWFIWEHIEDVGQVVDDLGDDVCTIKKTQSEILVEAA